MENIDDDITSILEQEGKTWSTVDKHPQSTRKYSDLFLRLDRTTTIRLVGKPIRHFVIWVDGRSVRCAEESIPRLEELGHDVEEYYACLCFEGTNPKEVCILEKGRNVFTHFKAYYAETGIDPGGPEAPEFRIVVTGSGKDRSYKVLTLQRRPLTEHEKTLVAKSEISLESVYQNKSNEEALARVLLERIRK